MHWVNLGLQAGHNKSTTNEDSLNRHGFFIGAAAQSDADQPASIFRHHGGEPGRPRPAWAPGSPWCASQLAHGRAALA